MSWGSIIRRPAIVMGAVFVASATVYLVIGLAVLGL
jgi:hypothetical protein